MTKYVSLDNLLRYTDNLVEALGFVHEVTYAELEEAYDADNLKPGRWYAITDYTTTTSQRYTLSADNNFLVLVQATSKNTFSEDAFARPNADDNYFSNANLSAWRLKYSFINDTSRFSWADTNGKGVIYYMKDEWGNEAPYDFKNIMFARYQINDITSMPENIASVVTKQSVLNVLNIDTSKQSIFLGWNELNTNTIGPFVTFTSSISESVWYYTFSRIDSGHYGIDLSVLFPGKIRNNSIKEHFTFNKLVIPNSVFIINGETEPSISNNILGLSCSTNTFYSSSTIIKDNALSDNCSENIFLNTGENTLGEGSSNNFIGNVLDSSENITFGTYCSNNFITDGVYHNFINGASYNFLDASEHCIMNANHCIAVGSHYCKADVDKANISGMSNIYAGKDNTGVIKYINIYDQFPVKAVAKMSEDSTTATIEPDVFYEFPEIPELNITLHEYPNSDLLLEYQFSFNSGATATVFSVPENVSWTSAVTIEANMHYEVNIVYNGTNGVYYGILVGWAWTAPEEEEGGE